MKKQILKEDLIGFLITLVFVIGFIVLANNSNITGFSVSKFGTTVAITKCTNLTAANAVYELSNDITLDWPKANKICINISADNIVLDCKGYTIAGNGTDNSQGILVGVSEPVINITIKNCHIKNFKSNIRLSKTINTTISKNDLECTPYFVGHQSCNIAVYTIGTNYTNITNNNMTNFRYSIALVGDKYLNIEWNNITTADGGIVVGSNAVPDSVNITHNTISKCGLGGFLATTQSPSIYMANNSFLYNDYAFRHFYPENFTFKNNRIIKYANQTDFRLMCEGGYAQCKSILLENNTINDKEIKFFGGSKGALNCPNNTVMDLATEDAGHIGLIACKNITIQDYNFNATNGGVTLLYTNESFIKNNNFHAYGGITLSHSDNNTIQDNHFYNSSSCIDTSMVSLYNNTDIRFVNNTLNATVGGITALMINEGEKIIIENNTFSGYQYAIYSPNQPCRLCNMTNNTIINIGQWAIQLNKLYNSSVKNNNIKNVGGGILNYNSKGVIFANNTLSNLGNNVVDGMYGVLNVGERTFWRQNKIKEFGTYFHILQMTTTRYGEKDDIYKFNLTFRYPNYTNVKNLKVNSLTTRPIETVNYHIQSNDIRGNFTVTRKGFYSLIVNITDDYNNTYNRNYVYLVDPLSKTIRYYLRAQPYDGYPGKARRYGILTLNKEKPTSEEKLEKFSARQCNTYRYYWYLKDIPEVGALLENVTPTIWYKTGPSCVVRVLTDVPSYSALKNLEPSLNFTNYTGIIGNTVETWIMDYPNSWDRFSMIFSATQQVAMGWKTNSTDPSYSDLYFRYGGYPAVKALSNTLINVLSATMDSDETEAKVVVEGEGWTNLTIVMPSEIEDVYYDNVLHNNSDKCNATIRGSIIYVDVAVASEHNISITTPSGQEGGSSPSLSSSKFATTHGLTKLIEFNNPNIPVISVELQLNREAPLELEARRVLDSFIEDKLDNSYAYFELKSNLDNSYFDYRKINFKIEKDFGDVTLYQLFDEPYKISTTKIYEDRDYNYYQAYVNSLGYFGIAKTSEKVSMYLESSDIEEVVEKVKESRGVGGIIEGILVLVLFILTFFYIKPRWKKL